MALLRSISGKVKGDLDFLGNATFNDGVGLSKERVGFTETFAQLPLLNASIGVVSNLNFELLGTNAADANSTYSTVTAGVLLTTAGADNDQMIVAPHLDTKQTAWTGTKWGTENQTRWEAVVKVTDSTDVLIWAGLKLTNTPVIATDADQAFFRYSTDDSDTTWQVEYSIAGTDTAVDSGVTVTAGSIYKFKIDIDSERKATFYIDDKAITTTTALTNDKDLIPYVGLQALSGAATTIVLISEQISRIIYE